VTIYRLLAAGTIEEKVFQRQLLKHAEAAAAGVAGPGDGVGAKPGGGGGGSGRFTRDELSELVAFSAAVVPATLAAAGWEDTMRDVAGGILRTSTRPTLHLRTRSAHLCEHSPRR
jgi:hypothetical protein